MLRKGIKWMLTNRPQYFPVCPKWRDMPCLWWYQLVEAKTAEYFSVVDDCIICCAKAENECWHTGHNIGQRPSCLSQMKWPDLPLVMPTGGGKDSRQQDGQVFFFSFFDLSANLSANNDCQNGPKKSHRPKRAKKLLEAIVPAGQCYRSQQWRRNLNGDTVFSCSMPARCCDWNHFWNNLVWDPLSGNNFQILEDRILLHFGNRSPACSVTQAEEKFATGWNWLLFR